MNAYERVEKMLANGMTEGNMHVCLRDAGRLAGGLKAGRSLSNSDLGNLRSVAVSLAIDKKAAAEKWDEAVTFGMAQPVDDTPRTREARHFGFDDEVCIGKTASPTPTPPVVIDERDVPEDDSLPEPASDWRPGDMIRYLAGMFEPDEHVGIVTEAREEGGKWRPNGRGQYERTRCELVEQLQAAGNDIGAVIGDPNPDAGVWVRINPLDGQGCKDANVVAFRHTLIEADDGDLAGQLARIRMLELPCTCIVHSGGKSIHALVRVDAPDLATYRTRVDRIYEVCQANGLKVDSANRNPSRLSRLPGVLRGLAPQYLIAERTGKATWEEWEKHIEAVTDDLPDPVQLADIWPNMPDLAPELIPGILREGHKMRLTGPSKGAKSCGLQELTCAIAEGKEWFGVPVKQGRVLYINLEVDAASCYHRFAEIYKALGWDPTTICDIDVWNLRGHAVPLIRLAPKLIRRAQGRHYKAIIFDPIYKLSWGDENDAGDVALFCNQLDSICHQLGCAVIDAHHHSKGAQGAKKSIDRGSGSGVFGRDPDAILDMVDLDLSKERRQVLTSTIWHAAVQDYAALEGLSDIGTKIEGPAWGTTDAFMLAFAAAYPLHAEEVGEVVNKALTKARRMSGWRVEGTLREFATPDPLHIWFSYPIHFRDPWGLLQDAKASGETPPWEEERQAREEAREAKEEAVQAAFFEAYRALGGSGKASVEGLADSLGKDASTIRRQAKKYGLARRKGLLFGEGEEGEEAEDDQT